MDLLKKTGFIVLGGLMLSGCTSVSEIVNQKEKIEIDSRPVNEQVEDFNSYKKSKTLILANGQSDVCQKFSDFQSQVKAGNIYEKIIFDGELFDLIVYRTDNYLGFNNSMLSDYNTKCIDGAGIPQILKAFPEYLIWGYPTCSAGAAPEEGDPLRQEFLSCQEMAENLQDYLSS